MIVQTRRARRLGWLVVAAMVLSACGGQGSKPATSSSGSNAPSGSPAGTSGSTSAPAPASTPKLAASQELRIATGTVPRNMDPVTTTAVSDYNFLRMVYDTLVTVDSGKPEPWAAESWQAIDPKHWRFKLRPGITFSNGEPFDAEAVRFTIQRALDNPKTPWRVRVANIVEMKIIDPLTIDFILDASVGNLPTRLSVVWIVPPKHTAAKGVTTDPVGTGPFTVGSYTPSKEIVLKARKGYWNGTPKLETVKIIQMPEASTRVSALLAGDVDVSHLILPEQVSQVEAKSFTVVSQPTGQSANIFFQTTTDSPVKNKLVRQAIDYAIDKQAIFQGITGGRGRFLEGQIVGPGSVGNSPSIKARPYDPKKAKELLTQAGYPNGFEIVMDHSVGRYFRDKDLVEAVAGYLGEVGIKVKLNPMSGSAWLDRLYSGSWGPMNYWSIQDAPGYDLSFTMEIFKSNNNRKIDADPKLDKFIDDSLNITDQEKRNGFLQDFAAYLFDQAYFIAFHQDPGIYGINPKVKDLEFLRSTYINLAKAYVTE